MLNRLEKNKDKIVSITAILQTIAIFLGVTLAINEFVFKDKQAEREKVKATLEIAEEINTGAFRNAEKRLWSMHLGAYYSNEESETDSKHNEENSKTFDEKVLEIRSVYEPYFQKINILIQSNVLDHELACERLFRYAFFYIEFIDEYPPRDLLDQEEFSYDLLSTYSFCQNCYKRNYLISGEYEGTRDKLEDDAIGNAYGIPKNIERK